MKVNLVNCLKFIDLTGVIRWMNRNVDEIDCNVDDKSFDYD